MFLRKQHNYASYTDEQLLFAYKEKQHKVIIAEYYKRYAHLVMGTSMKYLKNKQDAEDITMTIFEKLPKKLISHEIQYFKSWLYMVTKNECLMLLRKKGIATSDVSRELEAADDTAYVEEKEIQLSLLEEAIGTLKEEQRRCIELFYLDRKSYQEITNMLQIDIKKVKSAIQNGKRNLKLKLEGRNEFKSIT